jgi:hypothetical protein
MVVGDIEGDLATVVGHDVTALADALEGRQQDGILLLAATPEVLAKLRGLEVVAPIGQTVLSTHEDEALVAVVGVGALGELQRGLGVIPETEPVDPVVCHSSVRERAITGHERDVVAASGWEDESTSVHAGAASGGNGLLNPRHRAARDLARESHCVQGLEGRPARESSGKRV